MLSWMQREAVRHGLQGEDLRGGLILDEMSIQVLIIYLKNVLI